MTFYPGASRLFFAKTKHIAIGYRGPGVVNPALSDGVGRQVNPAEGMLSADISKNETCRSAVFS